MLPREQLAERLRFGCFEVNLATCEIFRDGRKVQLSGHPAEVLVFLVRRAGQLVTREELRLHLWPDETFVDFDHGLNNAINRIRAALGDSAASPLFIETLPKKGYRFIGEIRYLEDRAGSIDKEVEVPTTITPPEPAQPTPATDAGNGEMQSADRGMSRAERVRWKWLVSVTVATLLAAGAIWYLARPLPAPHVTDYIKLTSDGRIKLLVGTDGSRLYFDRREGTTQPISQVATAGGDSATLQVPLPNPWLLSVSSDGSELLVDSDDGLWKFRIPEGALHLIIKGVNITWGAWSPDGRSVAYTTDGGELYVIASEGGTPRLLCAEMRSSPKNDPQWSPDGSRIRFLEIGRLWEVSPDGTGLHEVFKRWRPSATLCCGRWSTDGSFYYFVERDPRLLFPRVMGRLWVSDERRTLFGRPASEPRQLTSGPLRWTMAIPSRDGRAIFSRGVVLRGELVRLESGLFKPWLGGISAEFVTFSPDGKSVAYVSFPEGILWRASRDGSNPVQLTSPPLYPKSPRWSPDGTQILFSNSTAASLGDWRIYTVGLQGGTPKLLVSENAEPGSDAAWSPDGRKIVFESLRSPERTIKIMDFDKQRIDIIPGSRGMHSVPGSQRPVPCCVQCPRRWNKCLRLSDTAMVKSASRTARLVV